MCLLRLRVGAFCIQVLVLLPLVAFAGVVPSFRHPFDIFGKDMRHVQDLILWCHESPLLLSPPYKAGTRRYYYFENGVRASEYGTTQEFCANFFLGGHAHNNMGGYCKSYDPRTRHSIIKFSTTLGDPVLIAVDAYRNYCETYCMCHGEAFDRGLTKIVDPARETKDDKYWNSVEKSLAKVYDSDSSPQREWISDLYDSWSNSPRHTGYQVNQAGQCSENAKCGDRDCSWTGVEGCRCLVARSTIAGLFKTIGCGIPLLISSSSTPKKMRLGGRAKVELTSPFGDEPPEIACPCNQSYVSLSCCSSGTGIVYEPADLRLGWVEDATE